MTFRIAALLPLALIAGCVGELAPTHPGAPAVTLARDRGPDVSNGAQGPDRVPLAVGNEWVYLRSYRLTLVPPGAPPRLVFQMSGTVTRTLGCLDSTESAVYAFERTVEVQRYDNVANTLVSWRDLRDDTHGLYEIIPDERDVPRCPELSAPDPDDGSILADPERLAAAAAAALPTSMSAADRTAGLAMIGTLARRTAELERPTRAGGSHDGERTRLVYPLRPGRRWSSDDAEVGGTVESHAIGRETCVVPAGAWRAMRIEQSWVGRSTPGDTITCWYGPVGLLRYRYRIVTGDPGRMRLITENELRLRRVRLAGARAVAGR